MHLPSYRALYVLPILGAGFLSAGCETGSLCELAASHLEECMGEPFPRPAASCQEDEAAAILEKSCSELTGDGKADAPGWVRDRTCRIFGWDETRSFCQCSQSMRVTNDWDGRPATVSDGFSVEFEQNGRVLQARESWNAGRYVVDRGSGITCDDEAILRVRYEGDVLAEVSVVPRETENVPIAVEQALCEEAPPNGSLTGRLFRGGRALANATVTIWGVEYERAVAQTQSQHDGRFALPAQCVLNHIEITETVTTTGYGYCRNCFACDDCFTECWNNFCPVEETNRLYYETVDLREIDHIELNLPR